MDFPVFHLDVLGNRVLIAVIATVHVLINHMLAVGAAPLVTSSSSGWASAPATTSGTAWPTGSCSSASSSPPPSGALTGVGIWLSTSLVNPTAIGA